MAHARRHDTCIGGYPIPFCCETAMLCKMYTLEELRVTGITIPSNLEVGHHWTWWPAGSEFKESDITDMEAICNTTEESTDTEMARHAGATLMISSDREKIRLEALTKEQDWAMSRALWEVQQHHLEELQLTASTTQGWNNECSSYKCHSALCKEDVKRTREESLEAGTAPCKKGHSLHCKSKSDLQFPTSLGKWHPGSRSFTPCMGHPCSRSKMPGQWCPQPRSDTPSRHRSQSKSGMPDTRHPCSRSSTPNPSWHRDSTPHTSRKWPVNHPPRPMEVTPTQSQAQKTPKLKSIVQWAPATQCYRDPPYKALKKDQLQFVQYLMGTLDCKAYDAEIRCLAVFSSQMTILARCVIAMTITTLVAANRGVHFLMPFIPSELMTTPPNPTDAELPGPPARNWEYQTDVRVKCKWEWLYLMHLLQYWHDAMTVYTYGGPVWQESKLMLFVYYRISAMLNSNSIFIWLYKVMDFTPWGRYYKDHSRPTEHIEYYKSHRHIIAGLDLLWNWLENRYLVEAMEEWKFLTIHSGLLDRIPFPHSYEDQRLGNEGPFYCSRGICPQIKPTLEDAPCIANSMLEVLAHHDQWQSEARDRQEYQRQ